MINSHSLSVIYFSTQKELNFLGYLFFEWKVCSQYLLQLFMHVTYQIFVQSTIFYEPQTFLHFEEYFYKLLLFMWLHFLVSCLLKGFSPPSDAFKHLAVAIFLLHTKPIEFVVSWSCMAKT